MDPNATYAKMYCVAREILKNSTASEDAAELAELVLTLNDWIMRGGFLPDAWTRCGREIRSLGQ